MMRFSAQFISVIFLATVLLACGGPKKTTGKATAKTTERKAPVSKKTPVNTSRKEPEYKKEPERKFVVIQAKYAEKLDVKPDEVKNLKLYEFIDTWYGAPYQYAGKSRSGVDCSGFTTILLGEVFQKNISGPSYSLYDQCEPVNKERLQEGDLVFFKINKGRISHVGVYLQNNKFVHASTRAGVIISDLNEAYYTKYFYKGGRLK